VQELSGKVAVVTGGASGIGLAMARRFAGEGMRVVLADIEEPALDAAVQALADSGAEVKGVVTDVADHASVVRLHDTTLDAFGGVHIVCNNAGVVGYSIAKSPIEVWEWVVGVNLFGVINGCNVFLPTLLEQDEGHVVNTASMAGLQGYGILGIYCTTKFAVVGLSESLAQELSGTNVGVSVVCPGFVRTLIAESERNMPESVRRVTEGAPGLLSQPVMTGIPPEQVAEAVLDAVRTDRLYVLTHPDLATTAFEQRTKLVFGEG
jgi:NAD(P)-dependent dehydrogenase (short-subunit alcohol dehydrogenase family)